LSNEKFEEKLETVTVPKLENDPFEQELKQNWQDIILVQLEK